MKGICSFLITLALIAGMVGCAPASAAAPAPTQCTLTISSTEGGDVTTPGEGTFTYDKGTVVYLVAEAEEGYSFVRWTGDVDTVGIVNGPMTTITMEDNCSITANFEPWDIEITNTDDQNDYPASVQSGGAYNITVDLRVNIPMGKTGMVSVGAYGNRILSDPPPARDVAGLLTPIQGEYLTEFGNGTHTVELSFAFLTPDVIRESWAEIWVDADLYEGNERKDSNIYIYRLTILPSKESAVDVKFTGTVKSLDVFWGIYVIGAYIRIDEVTVQDPWSLLTAGKTVYVGFESVRPVEEVSIGFGDKVEVYCDYHPGAGALIWRPEHYIIRVWAFALTWVLVGLAVAAVVVCFSWWRRRSRNIKRAH
jgi:hypothetical protein